MRKDYLSNFDPFSYRILTMTEDPKIREEELLAEAAEKGALGRAAIYTRLSGPGWLQGAITLGGGSLAGALYIGIIAGYGLLWLQPLAMVLGVIMLSAIGYVTLSTGRRPFEAIKTHVSVPLAWAWVIAVVMANIVWSMPQFSLGTAAIQQNLAPGVGAGTGSTIAICAVFFVIALGINYFYETGHQGVRVFEGILKAMVGLIVLSFFLVVGVLFVQGNLPFGEILAGFMPRLADLVSPAPAYQGLIAASGPFSEFWTDYIAFSQRDRIITAFGTAVGINMTFLLPYTMLRKRWGKKHRGLAIYDLSIGLIVPFVLATSCVVIAAAASFHAQTADVLEADGTPRAAMANTYYGVLGNHPAVVERLSQHGEFATPEARTAYLRESVDALSESDRQLGAMLANRDNFQLANALTPLTGEGIAQKVFGFGVLGMALSTIIILMLMNGFAFCEIFNKPGHRGIHMLGCAVSGVGGFMGPFIWGDADARAALAIPTSVIGGSLIPIAYLTFLLMMNSRSLLGESLPTGVRRVRWNLLMISATVIASFGSIWVLWGRTGAPGWQGWVAVMGLVVLATLFVLGVAGFFAKNSLRAGGNGNGQARGATGAEVGSDSMRRE